VCVCGVRVGVSVVCVFVVFVLCVFAFVCCVFDLNLHVRARLNMCV